MQNDAEIAGILEKMRSRLSEANAIAQAASTIAGEGWTDRAFAMALGIEELIHDASHLLQAAAVLNRQNKKHEEGEVAT